MSHDDPANTVKASGVLYINVQLVSNVAISFYNDTSTTMVTTVDSGYFVIGLAKNQAYKVKVWSPVYGLFFNDNNVRIFTRNSTLNIKLST